MIQSATFPTLHKNNHCGEHKSWKLEKACKQRRLGIKFEYSGQGMSHRNEMMEQSSRSCIYEFVLCLTIRELRKKFEIDSRRECASTARFYANILLNKVKRKLPLIDA